MRILHIVPSYKPAYQYGGTIESVANLCEGLVHFGQDVKVFTTTADGKHELNVTPGKEYTIEGVKVVYFKRITKDHSHVTFSLWRHLYHECKNYDIVHIHSWWNALVLASAFICKKKKVKIIISTHGMLSDYILKNSNRRIKKMIHGIMGRALLKKSILHTTSNAELAECQKLIPGCKVFTLYNIVWLPEVLVQRKQNEIFTIIFFSRIHPKKGIELLMKAISLLETKVCLQIAGTGDQDYIQQLKQLSVELKIDSQIEWLGWINRNEKFEVLMRADLFALTSYNENFANVVVESLYVGTPVLLSKEVGLSGFIADKNLGWVCELQTDTIQTQIAEAISDERKRTKIAVDGPTITKKYFSAETLIPEYIKHYANE